MATAALEDKCRVVVTGLGVMSPIGDSVSRFWDNLKQGKNGIRKITLFDAKDYYVDFAGEITVTDDHYQRFKSRKMAKRLDRNALFGYLAAQEAIDSAGIESVVAAHPQRYMSLIGSGAGGTGTWNRNGYLSIAQSMEAVHPLTVLNVIPSTAAGYFAQMYNLQGPSFAISSACSTSNYAFAVATGLIRSGFIDGAIAGGSEAAVCPLGVAAFGNLYSLSRRKDDPQTASRPFDVGRDGFVLGEGAGALCLERLDIAKKRGATIYCEIGGFGWSCDAHDLVAPRIDGAVSGYAMQMALDQAQLNPDDVNLINAHATSTQLGDAAEWSAIQRVFGAYASKIPTHSTKSMIGHLLGGSGGVEAVALIMAFKEGYAHHTINQFEQDPAIEFNVIKNEPLKIHARHILSNGFGFGGQNATIVFSRFDG